MNVVQAQDSDVKICVLLMRKFRNSYDAVKVDMTSVNEKTVMLRDIRRKAVFLIQDNNKTIGLVDIMQTTSRVNPLDDYNLIQNMYIEPQYRGQGIAKQVRQKMFSQHNVKGTVVTYARARQLREYYNSQGLHYIRPFPEYEFGGYDFNLCILSMHILPDMPKLFCKYDAEQGEWAQALAQTIANRVINNDIPNPQQEWLDKKAVA
jgi:GNAT superfamily N-acetyltransferase